MSRKTAPGASTSHHDPVSGASPARDQREHAEQHGGQRPPRRIPSGRSGRPRSRAVPASTASATATGASGATSTRTAIRSVTRGPAGPTESVVPNSARIRRWKTAATRDQQHEVEGDAELDDEGQRAGRPTPRPRRCRSRRSGRRAPRRAIGRRDEHQRERRWRPAPSRPAPRPRSRGRSAGTSATITSTSATAAPRRTSRPDSPAWGRDSRVRADRDRDDRASPARPSASAGRRRPRTRAERPGAIASAPAPSSSVCEVTSTAATAGAPRGHRAEARGDQQPEQAGAHAPPPAAQLTTPSSATRGAGERGVGGTSRRRILACQVSVSARATHEHDDASASAASAAARSRPGGAGRGRPRAPARPSGGRRRPTGAGQVAAGVLEQRPLVDHRQLEVGVGVVDRLAAGLGSTTRAIASAPHQWAGSAPDAGAGGRRPHRAQVGRAGGQRGDQRRRATSSASTNDGEA